MTNEEFFQAVLRGYIQIIETCLPLGFIIGACNVGFNIICSAFFGGHISFSRRGGN